MAEWIEKIKLMLDKMVSSGGSTGGGAASQDGIPLVLEAVQGNAIAYLLAQGVVLTTLLGQCAVAEVEGQSSSNEYRHELDVTAEAIVADWRALSDACQQVGLPVECIIGKNKEGFMTRSIVRMAQEVVGV